MKGRFSVLFLQFQYTYNVQFRDRVTKFERFINENEIKRRRAINKYYTEAKARENKSREIEALSAELADLKEK